MSAESLLLAVSVVIGLYVAWNIGANDLANAMGTSVGAGSLTLRQAVLLAAVFEFLGAVLVGAHVTETVRKGIVDPMNFSFEPYKFVYGMFSALLATGIWLQIATFLGMPVSTTHSIVGAIMGFGIAASGLGSIKWFKILSIVISWVVSPIVGGLISYLIFILIRKKILTDMHPGKMAHKLAPFLTFLVVIVVFLSFLYKGLRNLHLDFPFWQALLVWIVAGLVGSLTVGSIVRVRARNITGGYLKTENTFTYLQITTACSEAFAHGSNDVANAIGPIAAIIAVCSTGAISIEVEVPIEVLVLGGIGIIVGLGTWGYRVIETVGKKITEMTPSRGFSAEYGATITILLCSRMGLPVSTTHTLVGSVVGIGFARGIAAIDFRVIRNIVLSWLITLPITAALAALSYSIMLVVLR